jgi:hypothetical protein
MRAELGGFQLDPTRVRPSEEYLDGPRRCAPPDARCREMEGRMRTGADSRDRRSVGVRWW